MKMLIPLEEYTLEEQQVELEHQHWRIFSWAKDLPSNDIHECVLDEDKGPNV